MHEIEKLLLDTVKNDASDLHLSTGGRPVLRINGRLRQTTYERLSAAEILGLIEPLAGTERMDALKVGHTISFAHELAPPSGARFRFNVYPEMNGVSVAARHLPAKPPTPLEIGVPKEVIRQLAAVQGIILVAGATGSGKSTTLAACVRHIIENNTVHVITLENPIEYAYRDTGESIVHQREIGLHTPSFEDGIIEALRQDPDVIVIGEMRDAESIRRTLLAAETGHLVLATIHANSAAKAIDRITSALHPEEIESARQVLSEALRAVVAQQLLPTVNGEGRVLAAEVLINTSGVPATIREGKTHQIYSQIQTGRRAGMQTMSDALVSLVRERKIDVPTAEAHAIDLEDFRRALGAR